MFIRRIDDDLYLRLIDIGDAEAIFQLIDENRDYLREWLPWIDGTKTVDDSKGFIQFSKQIYAESKGMNCAIVYKNEIAGIVGYNTIDWQNRVATVGYWLGARFQGNGIMTRAVKMIIDYAFYELKLNKVEIRAAVENTKSRAIPERFGFVLEGIIRQGEWLYNHYVDHAAYGMLASEWIAKRN